MTSLNSRDTPRKSPFMIKKMVGKVSDRTSILFDPAKKCMVVKEAQGEDKMRK